MKKTYMMPLCEVLEMHNEQMIAASSLKMDSSIQVDQLSNGKDMWDNSPSGWSSDAWSGMEE